MVTITTAVLGVALARSNAGKPPSEVRRAMDGAQRECAIGHRPLVVLPPPTGPPPAWLLAAQPHPPPLALRLLCSQPLAGCIAGVPDGSGPGSRVCGGSRLGCAAAAAAAATLPVTWKLARSDFFLQLMPCKPVCTCCEILSSRCRPSVHGMCAVLCRTAVPPAPRRLQRARPGRPGAALGLCRAGTQAPPTGMEFFQRYCRLCGLHSHSSLGSNSPAAAPAAAAARCGPSRRQARASPATAWVARLGMRRRDAGSPGGLCSGRIQGRQRPPPPLGAAGCPRRPPPVARTCSCRCCQGSARSARGWWQHRQRPCSAPPRCGSCHLRLEQQPAPGQVLATAPSPYLRFVVLLAAGSVLAAALLIPLLQRAQQAMPVASRARTRRRSRSSSSGVGSSKAWVAAAAAVAALAAAAAAPAAAWAMRFALSSRRRALLCAWWAADLAVALPVQHWVIRSGRVPAILGKAAAWRRRPVCSACAWLPWPLDARHGPPPACHPLA